MSKQRLVLIGVTLVMLGVVVLTRGAWLADRLINRVYLESPYLAGDAAHELHQQLQVIDLHADPLLWQRDLLQQINYGHVDLPRLQQGNVALQVFGVVTGVPFPLRMENNRDRWDLISLLATFQGWPKAARQSRLKRALYQAEKLQAYSKASAGSLKLIKTVQDLDELLASRSADQRVVGGMLSLEGTHALEGEPANIETLFDAGFRMLGLVHLFNNQMAGSAHGDRMHGLTKKGRVVLQRALSLGMIIDLAHASPQTLDDVLAMVDRPVLVSHGGVRGTCDTARNLADRHVRAIANSGGVIGIGLYKYATCGKTLQDTVQAMRYVADLVGIEHVALGTDFDGAVTAVMDASGLSLLTEALLQDGFTATEIQAIMGGNALRVFRSVLPATQQQFSIEAEEIIVGCD